MSTTSRAHTNARKTVFRICAVVLAIALILLGALAWRYWVEDQAYRNLANVAFDSGANTSGQLSDFSIDWDYLRSINPDVVAWIYVPGTPIDYPVVHTDDNETYLSLNFSRDPSMGVYPGTIFLDESNHGDFTDRNNVMYGHHMNDGSMFACLSRQLSDESEFNANRAVYVFTPEVNYRCESFSLVLTTGQDSLAQTSFRDAAEFASFLQEIEARSVVQPDGGMPGAMGVSKMFMLSTCDYTQSNGRAVLFARVVEYAPPGSLSADDIPGSDEVQSAIDEAG